MDPNAAPTELPSLTVGTSPSAAAVSLADGVIAAGETALLGLIAKNGGVATAIVVPLAQEGALKLEEYFANRIPGWVDQAEGWVEKEVVAFEAWLRKEL